MPLTGTPNFSVQEALDASGGFIPPAYQDNAQATLELLEQVRALLGNVPLRLTSLYRSASTNADTASAASDSQHLTASAADVVPLGLSVDDAAQAIVAAVRQGYAPNFHQFIAEEASGGSGAHLHIGLGTGQNMLVRLASGAYADLVGWLSTAATAIENNPGTSSALAVALAAFFRGSGRLAVAS